ncbi:hypothetical protein M2324_000583 [Rhodovulum sulfidophilum]|nr:hypothetical protein [Rhodovulum sulfidophilum]
MSVFTAVPPFERSVAIVAVVPVRLLLFAQSRIYVTYLPDSGEKH